MIYHVDIADVPERLLALIRAVEQGEEVAITKNVQPVVQLIPVVAMPSHPQFGSARGRVHIRENSDAPLDDFSKYLP